VAPLYPGDDITDEDAVRALRGRGLVIVVGRAADPEVAVQLYRRRSRPRLNHRG
jgi:trehalose-6-phosphatase